MANHAIEKTKDHVIKLANKGDISNDDISKSQKGEIKNNTDGEFIKEIREQMEDNNLK